MKKISVVLFILILGGMYFWQKERPLHVVQSMEHWPVFDQKKVSDVRVINQDGEVITLHKADVWMLGDQQADEKAVLQIIHDLHVMKPIRVVSRNIKQYARLEVTDKATRVVLSAHGVTLLDLYVGKQGSDLISTYVRLQQSQEVVAVNKALVWQVNRQQSAWQKTEIAAVLSDAYTQPMSQNKNADVVVNDQYTDSYAHSL
ncbi:MAG: DUF4340 domain-containing protein [Mariprofundaceae bacterium]|nr:DUF4340 domain-containing protein [Mariprofundaceae bacterium]